MKRLIWGTLAVMMLVMGGCGSDTTVVVAPALSPPSITALQFTQDSLNLFINGEIVFQARDVDLDTITISVVNSGGQVVSRTVIDLRAFSGFRMGTIPFSIDYAVFPPGSYTFAIFLTDLVGSLSNPVFDTFLVPVP